eukprot:TRINITY_DN2207_c0_g1_i1.p1 TRINITY_DN2207_c0_g1~~TRINITY_DN2207_c0_g1_i1.p1  ORF type:complete len:698 (-),score=261.33 TRINITY_DN2207_c0_g1_i1:25-1848(-)
MIQDFLKNSKWNHHGPRVVAIVSTATSSAGDALREIQGKEVIKNDFILISGDVLSNMDLRKVIVEHKARYKQNKQAIMTTVMKVAQPNHRTRSSQDEIIVAIAKDTQQILFYNTEMDKQIGLETEILKEHKEVSLRYDLLDCRIDVCAPEVLLLFADNFDYEDVRSDFIRGMLTSEILGNKVHAHIIDGEYAARVKDLRTYDSVSKDIMHRWTYPLVPDSNFLGNTTYTLSRNHCYREKNCIVSRSSRVSQEIVLGSGTEVGDEANISHSIIGRNCKIGKNVVIHGSYIWDNVVVEDNVVIQRSIVCNGARLFKGCKIEKGCVVGYMVNVGEGIVVPTQTKLIAESPETSEDDLEDGVHLEKINLGKGGNGLRWTQEDEDPNNCIISVERQKEREKVKRGKNFVDSDPETDSDVETPMMTRQQEEENYRHQPTDEEKFIKEATDIVHSSFVEKHAIDNVVLELNSLKYAYNTNFSDCSIIILKTILDQSKDIEGTKFLQSIQNNLKQWSELLSRFVTSEDDQVELMWDLESFCEIPEKSKFRAVFPMILHALHNVDVLEEEGILKWAKEHKEDDRKFVDLSKDFLAWLEQSEDEEGDDDDDDEEDEE